MADHDDDDATPDTPSGEPGPDLEPAAGSEPDGADDAGAVVPGETPTEPAAVDTAADDDDTDTDTDDAAAEDEVVADDDDAGDTVEGEVVAGDDEVEGDDGEPTDDTAQGEVVVAGEPDEAAATDDDAGRPAWVVPFLLGVVAVVAVVLGVVALAGGDDDEDAAAEEDGDAGADTTVGTPVPPVTTAPGTPTAGLLSDLEPVDSDTWEPADAEVTIGGAAHAETVVSGPIGTCDDGDAQTVTYDLAGGYTWLEGIVGLVDGTETGLTVEIGFEADGEEVWWQTFAEGESTRVQLDLTDARELTVTAAGLFPGTDAGEACVRAGYGDLTLR